MTCEYVNVYFHKCVYLRKDKASIEYNSDEHYSNVILSRVADKSVSDKLLSSSTGVMSPLWSLELLNRSFLRIWWHSFKTRVTLEKKSQFVNFVRDLETYWTQSVIWILFAEICSGYNHGLWLGLCSLCKM